jgi:pilus assembly protein Flp/PilA
LGSILTWLQWIARIVLHGSDRPPKWLRARSNSHVDQGVRIMKSLATRFAKDESGATAIEYGLIAAGISVAIITVVNGVGSKVSATFSSISTQMK